MSAEQILAAFLPKPQSLVGAFRRFGETGPVYEVLQVLHQLPDGDFLMKIQVQGPEEIAEVLERKYSLIIRDPEE